VKARRPADPMAEARPTVHKRSGGMCERCGARRAIDVHHRQLRRHGDHRPANLVDLCRECHTWVHGHVALAQCEGFIVESWEDPREVRLKHAWLGPVTLDDQGGAAAPRCQNISLAGTRSTR
jgi:hypothetical protein